MRELRLLRCAPILMLVAFSFVCLLAPLYLSAQTPILDPATAVVVHGGQGSLWLRLSDGHQVPASFTSGSEEAAPVQLGASVPLAMASEDFDADGYPDLVCAYGASGGGVLALYRGNGRAFAPASDDYLKNLAVGKTPSPFLLDVSTFSTPVPPDFLEVGDFSGDGWPDVLVGARGGSKIYLLRGDGSGQLSTPEAISLPGSLTALTSGTIDRPTGRTSVVAAIDGLRGPSVAIFEGANDLRDDVPSICPLSAPASALALGQLDDAAPADLAILSGGRIFILHGRNQTSGLPDDPSQRLEPVSLPSSVQSMALGRFIWTRTSQTQIGVLASDGSVSILSRGTPESRPFTREEVRARRLALLEHRPLPDQALAQEWAPGQSLAWSVAAQVALGLDPSAAVSLQSARLSAQAADDLLLSDASGHKLQILYPEIVGRKLTGNRRLLSLDVAGTLAAVRPMRVSADGRPGLVVLTKDRVAPVVLTPLAVTYYQVTGTGDSTNSTPTSGSGTAGDPYLMTTLRGAVIKANADAGPGTITFAPALNGAPITLTIAGLETDSLAGDLDINDALTIIGSGTANTILQGGTTSSNGIDKIFDTNATGAVGGFPVSISGLTMRYGKNTHPWDGVNYTMEAGAMYFWNGWDNAGSLAMDSCVFDQNQVATPGPTAGGRGGALVIDAMAGGAVTISNCTFSNNQTNGGLGGAIGEGSVGAPVTITNCTISNCKAGTAQSSEGGGLYSYTDTSGTMVLHNCAFSGNTATSRGGSISFNGGTGHIFTLDQNSSVTNSTSFGTLNGAGEGGGIYESSYTGTGSFTVNGVTITGNTAGSASGDNRGGGGLAFGSGDETVKFCRISGNAAFNGNPSAPDWGTGLHKDYNGGTATAINNWWGCNAGPGGSGCDSAIHSHCCPPLPPPNGTINAATWLVLQISASPNSLNVGQTSTLTANLNHNNLGASVAGPDYIPNGTSVAFGGTLGTASPSPVGTTNGTASSTFTASSGGSGSGTATVDNQTVSAPITIATCDLAVTTNPSNQSACPGSGVSFTAAASATVTPTVQWQVSTDGGATFNDVPGATSTTLTFTTAAGQNGYRYRAVFTNSCGTATTTAATLTVNTAPAVTTNPSSQAVCVASTATFTAAASGSPAPTVQWQVSTDGGATFSDVPGATSTTLSFTVALAQDGYRYLAVFTNTCGTATTTAATLTVNVAPAITTNPSNQTVCAGSSVSFSAAASGTPTPTVQWQVSTNGGGTFNNVAGATSTTLTFTTSAGQNGNEYRAVFTASCGTATTTAATLTVNAAPSVTTNPSQQTICVGSTATFTAAANGSPAPTVQWQVSTDGGATFNDVPGATSTTLSFTTSVGQNGYRYRAVFTNTCGSATTTAAVLTVSTGPAITTNPSSQTVYEGSGASFTASAGGSPAPSVQWQVSTDGGATFNDIPGAVSIPLSFTASLGQDGNQFRAVFTNACGTSTTSAATLTVYPLVVATAATPGPTTGLTPLTVSFTGAGSGGDGGPYTFDWNFGDGSPQSVAQNPSHTYNVGGSFTVTLTVRDGHGVAGIDNHLVIVVTATSVPVVYNIYDDLGRSRVCLNRLTGAYVWSVPAASPTTTYTGTAQVLNGGTRFVSSPGAPVTLNVTIDPLRKKGSGYLISGSAYVPVSDANITNNPPGCY